MSKQKATGTRYETAVVRYMQGALQDLRIERRALHGAKDMGDIYHIYAHGNEGVAECKAHKSVTRSLLESWRDQTIDERDNANADFGLLIVKRANHGVGESIVHCTICDLTRLCLGVEQSGVVDLYDDAWVCMTLEECCLLIRGV